MMRRQTTDFVVCVNNDEYAASLERRKIYETVPDQDAESHGMIRVVDESGEDYLYPKSLFMEIRVPKPVCHALDLAS